MKTIALDYDDTYTADPILWENFIKHAHHRGHRIYIVTLRGDHQTYGGNFEELSVFFGVSTIFCNGRPKQEVTKELGISIDIWIDDNPLGILEGSKYTPQQLLVWEAEQIAKM